MDDHTRSLLNDPPGQLLVRLATPNSVAFLIQSGVSLTEVWFIGRLGSVSLAAIALVFPLLMLTQMLSGGAMGGAVAASIARALGAGDQERAERLIWHALALAVAGAVILLVSYLLGGMLFLQFLGGQGLVLEQADTYALILLSGGLFVWFMGIGGAIYRGMGDMKFPAGLMVLGAAIQVPLSGCLILGPGPLPSLGIAGAAVSAIMSGAVLSTIMLTRLARGRARLKLRLSALKLSGELFADILKVTLPASLSPLLTVTTIISLTAIVGRFGQDALAGYGIGSRIEFLLVPLVFGLGAAMTSLVGMSIGAGNPDRAEQIGWTGGFGAALIAGLLGVTLALTASYWIPVFTSDPGAFEAARLYIQLVGPCFALNGLGLSLYFASQGAGAMMWPVTATVVRVCVAVGGALWLSGEFGLQGVYMAAAAGMVIYGSMIAISLRLGAWR